MIFACIQLFCCCLIIYLEFCSSDNIPDVSELPSPKKFHVLGMSVYDHPDDDTNSVARWWKWYMPSFYKMNLKGLKVDFTPQNAWNDSSSCQIRFYGFLKKLGSEGYWDGGHGSLMLPSLDKPLKCYYLSAAQSHVNIGHGSKHLFEREQAAKQLMAVAIYCPLPKKRKKVCEAMDTKRITNEVRLYPTGWEKTFMAYPPYEYIGSIFTSKQGRMQLPQIKPNMKKLNLREGKVKHPKVVGLSEDKPPGAPASVASDMKANKPPFALPSTELLVCTVQTFQNEMTGPMLYLFALHYCNLGFQVVVYDRYGRHVEFMRELIEECYVIYHPFTAYEVGLPGEYSAEKVKNESGTFKFFYHFEVNDKFSVADDTRLQDQDKMITFDTARVQYSSYRLFLALDSDELLVPDPHSSAFKQHQSKISRTDSSPSSWGGSIVDLLSKGRDRDSSPYPPIGFKSFITKYLSKASLAHTEEMMIFRYAAAASTPSGVVHPKNISEDGDMVAYMAACLLTGYQQRDFLAMAHCFSSSVVFDRRFVKFIDTQSTCAFHYLHNGCNLVKADPPAQTTPDDLAEVDFGCFCSKRRATLKGMYLLHLNHNNFCSKISRKKDPDIVQVGRTNPLTNTDVMLVPSD